MNWKQGLFRVWLVLSALWIAGVCVQAVPSVRKSLEAIYALDGLAGLDLSKLTDAQMLRFSVLPPPPPGFTLDGSVVQFPDGGRLSLPQLVGGSLGPGPLGISAPGCPVVSRLCPVLGQPRLQAGIASEALANLLSGSPIGCVHQNRFKCSWR